MRIDIEKAKETLPELLDAATGGQEVVLTRDDRPVARLVPIADERRPRRFGSARSLITISDDFDAPPEDFADYMR
jgi:prevent-host-death family protein